MNETLHRAPGLRTLALLAAAAVAAGLPAWAQAQGQAGAQETQRQDAGSLMKELTPPLVSPGTPAAPPLELPRRVNPPLVGGATFKVGGFKLIGLDSERAAALLPLLDRYIGDGRQLLDLEDAAKDVEVVLQRQGLFLAQVYVPEQTLSDGVVALQVVEGRIGNVQLEVDPAVKVDPELMDRFIAILRGNPVAERERVERALFALGDLRGIQVTSSLTPGDKPGYADLTVKVGAGARVSVSADIDNGGSIFTGRFRVGGNLEWLSPTGRGDSLTLRALASTNGGVMFTRLGWLMPVGARGTKFGLAASALRYKLGSSVFEPLDATGTGYALSAQLLHPMIRSRNNNLFLQGSFDRRRFEDKVGAIDLISRKSVTSYFTLGVVGDWRDTLLGGGISNYSANLVGGQLKLETAEDVDTDRRNYNAAGRYGKLVVTGSRLQALPNKDYLYFSALAQFASKDLDSSEKQSLGGPYGVRGYPAPDTPSDSAVMFGWEYRKPLAIEAYAGDWVLAVFGDYGVGRQHESPLPSDTDNVRRLYSHGAGLTYGNYSGLVVKGWVAVRGDTEAQSDDSRARAYLQLSKLF